MKMLTPPVRPRRWHFRLPKTSSDVMGMLVFWFGGVLLLWYETSHILLDYYPPIDDLDDDQLPQQQRELNIQYAVAFFFAFNIYGNMYKIVTTDTTMTRLMFTSGTLMPDGWRYCSECDLNLPPRSHHCKICDVCVLKRDHHCWFTGCCIGYFNHRYYVAMVTHMVTAALYCNIYNLDFVVSIKGHLTLYNFLSYLAPHMGLLLGYYGIYIFFITAMTSIGTLLLGLFSWLLYAQLTQIFYGQTKHELEKNIKKYNLGIIHTLREVLGKRWYLALLLPWIPSPLPGNACQFKMKKE